ncbi:MAG TPA: AraC family transcriptional regulator [Pseudomonadales bacterium]
MTKAHSTHYARCITRVLDYIETHLDGDLSVEALSDVAHFSPYHFHRQFTAYTGIGVGRLVQMLRLRRASLQLAFNPGASVTDIAFDAGFANAESFSRAFRRETGLTPSAFRKRPAWSAWQVKTVPHIVRQPLEQEHRNMKVEIVDFPETRVAALEHRGPEHLTYETTKQFIAWRQANGYPPGRGKTYGVHYTDPATTLPEDYRLDLCLSVDEPVAPNPQGVVAKTIPGGRCACVRHVGSRHHVHPAAWLYREWLPQSGEVLRDFPIFFHYVNVGPGVKEHEMVTDVYLPLK